MGGNFILKVFDLFNYKTIQLLYILYNTYSSVLFLNHQQVDYQILKNI